MLRECALWSYTYIPVFIQIRSGFVGVITEKPFYDPQSDYNMGAIGFFELALCAGRATPPPTIRFFPAAQMFS